MQVNILGVKIDDISLDEALATVENWLKGNQKHYIVTPNPEFIVAAQSDLLFKKILNDADLSVPDGVGLKISGKVKNRVAGIDLMERLISEAAENGYSIGLLGGKKGLAQRCQYLLKQKNPQLNIAYANDGGVINIDGVGEELNIPPLDLLFVAFGHGKQEKWIAKNSDKYPVKVMMGVGGSLDYISGEVTRAPRILRILGLEWLFRLILEPWRIKRQIQLLKFIYLILVR